MTFDKQFGASSDASHPPSRLRRILLVLKWRGPFLIVLPGSPIVYMAAGLMAFGLGLGSAAAIRLILVIGIAWLLLLVPAIFWRMSARARVRKWRYHVCRRCDFILSVAPEVGICPECGEAYTHERLEQYWRQLAAAPFHWGPGRGEHDI